MPGLQGTALAESVFIGACVECFFCGIYSALFAMYLQHNFSTNGGDKRPTSIIFYSICTLYVLCVIIVTVDISEFVHVVRVSSSDVWILYPTCRISTVMSGCCDFIAQCILIYRCWIVWNHNIFVIIIPLILTFTFLTLWIVGVISEVFVISQQHIIIPEWGYVFIVTSTVMSLVVNALVTGLIVFKIVKVYLKVKPFSSGATGGSRLRPIIFVIVESGMALLAIQLSYFVMMLTRTQGAIVASQLVLPIQRMLNGITPTIIQVRVSMGLSFHDEESMVEVTGTLHFESVNDPQNSIADMENGMRVDHQENWGNHMGGKNSNEIDHTDIQQNYG